MPHNCHFCRQFTALSKLPPSEVVWQFPHSVAFLGRWQSYPGYCVLVARTHATELSALEDAERRAYLDEMCLLAKAIEAAFRPHKLNYELLGNQVPLKPVPAKLFVSSCPRSAGQRNTLEGFMYG